MKDLSIFCIGDSLVYGYGVRRSQFWTGLLSELTGAKVENCGINGDTTAGMLSRLHTWILPEMRKSSSGCCCAVILGGCNDIFFTGSDLTARENMVAMTMALRAAGVRPIVCIPGGIGKSGFPEEWAALVDFRKSAKIMEDYADWLAKYCAAFGIDCVDLRPAFAMAGEEFFLDGIHPGPEGQRIIAQSLCEVIAIIYGN